MTARELAQQLKTRFGDLISEPAEFRGEITVQLSDADCIAEICDFAKKQLGFDFLQEIKTKLLLGEITNLRDAVGIGELHGNFAAELGWLGDQVSKPCL